MFNLKRKTKQVVNEIKKSFEPIRDPQEVITEIHNEFDTVTEKLLTEAKEILSGIKDVQKGERLKSLGFNCSKPAVDAEEEIRKRDKNMEIAKNIEYYSIQYPNNKFITFEKASEICKKYGLLLGNAFFYKGDVPEKNLSEIENFKLREEDYTKYPVYEYMDDKGQKIRYYYEYDVYGRHNHTVVTDESIKVVSKKEGFKICASVKDFDTSNMRIEDGYRLEYNLPDPIVLQPVNGGYLIVSKWGLEGEDAELTNEKMN
jgi:hypothetical protein